MYFEFLLLFSQENFLETLLQCWEKKSKPRFWTFNLTFRPIHTHQFFWKTNGDLFQAPRLCHQVNFLQTLFEGQKKLKTAFPNVKPHFSSTPYTKPLVSIYTWKYRPYNLSTDRYHRVQVPRAFLKFLSSLDPFLAFERSKKTSSGILDGWCKNHSFLSPMLTKMQFFSNTLFLRWFLFST